MDLTHPPLLDQIKQFMDRSVRRQEIISSNLANVDTPGYRARRLRFSQTLASEMAPRMKKTAKGFASPPGRLRARAVSRGSVGALGNDKNDVSLDTEMTKLAQNLLKFSIVSEIYQKKIQLIRFSIREGRT